ncbi:MAG: stage sporulation protein [Firmicutes bacterium]|nr:stage sporulation protein [Bacillota bacterium]
MNKLLALILTVMLVVGAFGVAGAHERSDGGYYTIVDDNGAAVFVTGWKVEAGDQCLTENNKRYEVVSVEGDIAKAKFIGDVDISLYTPHRVTEEELRIGRLFGSQSAVAQGGKVAIYHTHDDESYVPTEGKESIDGNGGILAVGNAFAAALEAKGMPVIHSMNKHDPHDDMAYERSRRTVVDLLKEQPAAIFDVHRDAVPPEVYKTNINGQDCTKVQLVVGKYGPTGKQVEDYAMQLKSASDQQHPGLVKGIFFAKGGDYNEDLHPRAMLLEVGAHTNDRPSAERGIALFADAIPTVLGQTSGTPGTPSGTTGLGTTGAGPSGSAKSIGWIVGLLVVGVVAFLFISTGSFNEAKSKLKQFGTTEFANFFGPKKKPEKKHDDFERNDDDKNDS